MADTTSTSQNTSPRSTAPTKPLVLASSRNTSAQSLRDSRLQAVTNFNFTANRSQNSVTPPLAAPAGDSSAPADTTTHTPDPSEKGPVTVNFTKPVDYDRMDSKDKIALLEEAKAKGELENEPALLEELDTLKNNNNNQNSENEDNTPDNVNAGKVDKPFRDPDWGEPEKGKFDIQQGDIIEFMMKDIVLAATAEAGDKFFGMVGYGFYRAGSGIYHKLEDSYVSGKEKRRADKAKEQEEREKALKKARGIPDSDENLKIQKEDDHTTAFSKKVRQYRKEMIKYNEVDYNRETIMELVSKSLSSDWNPKKLSQEEKQLYNRYQDHFEALHTAAAKNNYNPEYTDNVKDITVDRMVEYSQDADSLNIFAANYAAAAMIQAEAAKKSPDSFTKDRDMQALFTAYINQGKKIYLNNEINFLRGNEYQSEPSMLETSKQAYNHAYNMIKDGKYAQKDKEPPANEALNKIDASWKEQPSKVSKQELTTLNKAFNEARSEALMIDYQYSNEKVKGLEADYYNNQNSQTRRIIDNLKQRRNNPDYGKDKTTDVPGKAPRQGNDGR